MAFEPHNVPSLSVASLTNPAEGYARWAPTYDGSPNPLLAREQRYLLPMLGDVRSKRILDLACGTGRWLEKLEAQGSQFSIGVDCSAAMLRVATGKRTIAGHLTRGTCGALPFRSQLFDLAICSFALGHIADLGNFSAEAARVSKPGADLFVTDLHPAAYDHGWRVGFRDHRTAVEIEVLSRSAHEIIAAFTSNGFRCISQDSLWLEAPEQIIFAHAGKEERFASTSRIPAIVTFHFRRSEDATDVWET